MSDKGRDRWRLAVALCAALVFPCAAWPEQDGAAATLLAPGARVRLSAPTIADGSIQGTVVEIDDKSLLLTTDDHVPLKVPHQNITELKVSNGRRGHARTGLIIGALFGAAVGATAPTAATCSPEQTARGECTELTRGGLFVVATLAEAGFGALIGHLIKSDRWVSVPPDRIRVILAPTETRGARVSLSVRW